MFRKVSLNRRPCHARRFTAIATCLLAILATTPFALAETRYVVDRLELGIHEDKSADSPILELIPSGSAVEIMASDDTFTQVRTQDGVVGWVDGRYLMAEKPAQLELATLQAQHSETQSRLEEAELRVEDLSAQLEDTSTGAQQESADEIERLTEENALLKEELLNIEQSAFAEVVLMPLLEEQPAPQAQQTPSTPTPRRAARDQSVFGLSKYQWIFIAALAVLFFGLGAYLVDYSTRKRHGGFRL